MFEFDSCIFGGKISNNFRCALIFLPLPSRDFAGQFLHLVLASLRSLHINVRVILYWLHQYKPMVLLDYMDGCTHLGPLPFRRQILLSLVRVYKTFLSLVTVFRMILEKRASNSSPFLLNLTTANAIDNHPSCIAKSCTNIDPLEIICRSIPLGIDFKIHPNF